MPWPVTFEFWQRHCHWSKMNPLDIDDDDDDDDDDNDTLSM